MKLSKKCLVDTNVPITANRAQDPSAVADDLIDCVARCVDAVEQVIKTGGLVLDAGGEIYKKYLS